MTAGEFHYKLAMEDDKSLYAPADAIRQCFGYSSKVARDPKTLVQMIQLGLVDDTNHLTDVGRSIWNRLHS